MVKPVETYNKASSSFSNRWSDSLPNTRSHEKTQNSTGKRNQLVDNRNQLVDNKNQLVDNKNRSRGNRNDSQNYHHNNRSQPFENKRAANPPKKEDQPIKKNNYTSPVYSPLIDKWVLYYHLPDDTSWDLASYTAIMTDIDGPEKLISINEVIPDVIIKNAMLFVMRSGIAPMWEDERNRHGGYLSFKIVNKLVHHVWKTMFYGVCGETLFEKKEDNRYINGLSISPKKTFCIIKIWLSDACVKDSPIIPIPNVSTSPEEMKYTSFETQIETDKNK